jgi:dTDP-4-dehydrorhamnose reductase
MTIVIVGGYGQLGRELARVLAGYDICALSHERIEICDAVSVDTVVSDLRPEVVINCAAYNRVDDAEEHAREAFAVNGEGVLNLARSAERCGALLVHISTDYVFDGGQSVPYLVTDCPAPLNLYGLSKLAGEWAARRYASRHLVVRTCGLYGMGGSRSKGTNFVETMIRLAESGSRARVVNDQVATPTSASDLALALKQLIEKRATGVFHVTNQGQCSWFEFGREIFARLGRPGSILPITSAEFNSRARRPPYSVLDNGRLVDAGIPLLRSWQEALHAYLDERLGSFATGGT